MTELASSLKFLLAGGKLTKDDLLASVIDVLFAGVKTTTLRPGYVRPSAYILFSPLSREDRKKT